MHPDRQQRLDDVDGGAADDISGGRFGVNIVSGWNQSEYAQMGVWPGDWYYDRRYEYGREYVTVMKELWSTGVSDLEGAFFTMDDCWLSPVPAAGKIPLVCAGQSDTGLKFCAEHGDFQFIIGDDSTETWDRYREGADLEAIAYMTGQASLDTSGSTAEAITQLKSAFNLNIGAIVGSYETCAAKLDAIGDIPGVRGVMCIFDDFPVATEDFGRNVMPLMGSRAS